MNSRENIAHKCLHKNQIDDQIHSPKPQENLTKPACKDMGHTFLPELHPH
jgi:hypothetical protein